MHTPQGKPTSLLMYPIGKGPGSQSPRGILKHSLSNESMFDRANTSQQVELTETCMDEIGKALKKKKGHTGNQYGTTFI